ncbi:hypothetical protein [Streptomyces sp. FIT100]|uniref:hypothetical protein n=1 Tax=Streptomyces sp. FIT100 TaxID=2837956 RepID=UPI0021C5ED23|nr:hypothetical protein [Streptomyces sp. FIT100]
MDDVPADRGHLDRDAGMLPLEAVGQLAESLALLPHAPHGERLLLVQCRLADGSAGARAEYGHHRREGDGDARHSRLPDRAGQGELLLESW